MYNGLLYAADSNQLRSINPATGAVTAVGAGFAGPSTFGAMIGASNGVFGLAGTGGFYQFDPTTGTATPIAGSPTSSGNDGAKCASSALTLPADLAVTKTDNRTTYVPGQMVTYTIVVSNAGPFGVQNAVVNDPLPAGISSASWTCAPGANGGTCSAASGSGGIANVRVNLPVNATVTFTLTITVPPGFTGDLVNTATVTAPSTTADANSANDTATDSDTPVKVDLAITKVSAPNPYVAGEALSYTIVASNLGPDPILGALVQDTFPGPLGAFTWTCAAGAGATCSANGGPGVINDVVNLPVGSSVTYTVTGTVPPATGGPLTNTATVTPPPATLDPVPGNNTASDSNPAGPKADLSISKASTPNPFVPGETLTYTVVATNAGPSNAIGARVQDSLPPGLTGFTWTCAPSIGASCPASGTGDIDSLVDLPTGTAVTFTITGTVPSGYTSSAANTATVTLPSDVTDPVPGNNTSTIQNPPNLIADLAITKVQTPDPYTPGGALTYTLLVQNLGPSDATNARVQDALPGELTGATWTCNASGAGASCGTPAGGNVIDALVTVPAGTSATFTITATVIASATGVLSNTAPWRRRWMSRIQCPGTTPRR